jgi:multiple sugar transport system ATP-binding protein
VDARVKEVAGALGLSEVLDRRPGQLSGGQRQRVAMGRAMVREPSVFLMDEPLSNLDAKLRVQMRAEVARVQRRIGVAAVYVTHDQTEAMTLGHRVAVLREGNLQQCDAPQTLYDRPANTFVAGFIGSPAMNLFEAALSDDLNTIELGGQRLAMPPGTQAERRGLPAYSAKQVVVGIRPEDLTIAETDDHPCALRGDVELVEALGAEQLVHFRLDGTTVQSHRDDVPAGNGLTDLDEGVSVARLDPHPRVKPGTRISLSLAPTRIEFFDPDNGLAIWG